MRSDFLIVMRVFLFSGIIVMYYISVVVMVI